MSLHLYCNLLFFSKKEPELDVSYIVSTFNYPSVVYKRIYLTITLNELKALDSLLRN